MPKKGHTGEPTVALLRQADGIALHVFHVILFPGTS